MAVTGRRWFFVSSRAFYAAACLAGVLGGSLASAQQPAAAPMDPAAAAGAQLIVTAEQDADGYLFLPLPKPQPMQTVSDFELRKQRARNEVNRLLREDAALSPADLLVVEKYFNNFEFRTLTQTTPEDLEQLPKRRFDFFKLYILQCKHQTNHQTMIDLTLAMMQQIVLNNFHPVVRYNAMLIIGDLNEQEDRRVGASPLLPEPYAAALTFIVDRIDNPTTPDPVRVAALVGLIRHLEWEPFRAKDKPIPPGLRTTMLNALVKLAEMKTPPDKRSAEGQLWMRRRAIEALGLASVTTANPREVTVIEKILKDTSEPLQLRFAAALALGRANVPQGFNLDANELARTLGNLAAASIKSEFDRLDTMDKAEKERREAYVGLADTGVGGGQVPGGGIRYGEGAGGIPAAGANDLEPDPKHYRLEPIRKRLRYQLYCVQTGLGHPLDKTPPAAGTAVPRKGAQRIGNAPAEKKAAEDVLTAVNKLADIIEKNKLDLIQLKTDLKNETKNLEAAVARHVPAAAPAAAPMPGVPAVPGAPIPKPAVPATDDDILGGAPAKK